MPVYAKFCHHVPTDLHSQNPAMACLPLAQIGRHVVCIYQRKDAIEVDPTSTASSPRAKARSQIQNHSGSTSFVCFCFASSILPSSKFSTSESLVDPEYLQNDRMKSEMDWSRYQRNTHPNAMSHRPPTPADIAAKNFAIYPWARAEK